MIPNDFIDTLLRRVDIVEVIDRYVPLRKAGANYVACCPFHSEKTPSFSVSPSKQFYHCFGCGAHGTAIGFLMEHAGKSFPDAVEDLAREAGLDVPRIERAGEKERREETADLNELLLTAARFYRARLKDAPAAIDYLKSRGLTGEVAVRFGIGYAPDAWQGLAAAFANYEDPALEAAGLVIAGDGDKRYDRFRDRVMFPIHDSRGRVIGFGGRVIGSGEPKYLNSPETPVFSKGRELYGLYLARNAIRDAGKVIVVEGYMDVVALAQHGVEHAVATLGTSTTPVHAQKLFRLTDTVVFCFDGDAAGRKAAWRALENTLPVLADGKNALFLFLPEGEDPDDYVRRRGRAALEQAVAAAVPLSEFLLAEVAARHPPTSAEGRAALVAAARPYLGEIAAPVLAALLRKRLAQLSDLPEDELRGLIGTAAPAPEVRPYRVSGARPPIRRPPSMTRQFIRGLLLVPALAKTLAFPEPDERTSETAALTALVGHCALADPPPTTAGILQAFADSPHAGLFASILAAAEDDPLDDLAVEAEMREGLERWWQQARRYGRPAPAAGAVLPEEGRRLEQLDYVRQRAAGDAARRGFPEPPDGPPPEGPS
jgi:DNA primase